MQCRKQSLTFLSIGRLNSTRPGRLLLALLLTSSLAISACQSKPPMESCAAPLVVVDQSLMAESHFETRMLNFLSENPSEQTSPSTLSNKP